MAIRYSGTVRVYVHAMDKGGLDGRYYYTGSVVGPDGERWPFAELSPSPMDTPGPEGLAIDNPLAYDRAACEALHWAWISGDDGAGDWVFNCGEMHPDHETEDRFIVARKPLARRPE